MQVSTETPQQKQNRKITQKQHEEDVPTLNAHVEMKMSLETI